MKRTIFLLLNLLILLSGCKDEYGGKTMSIGKPEYVKQFPESGEPTPIKDFTCDVIGMRSVKSVDNLLIISQAGMWTIASDDGKTIYGDCLSTGGGPGEFAFIPYSGASAYRSENDSLVAYLCDKNNGRIMRFNISEFIDTGKENIKCVLKTDKMYDMVWDAIPLGGDSAILAQPNEQITGFRRMLLSGDSVSELAATRSLSEPTLESEDHPNVLAKVTRCSPDGKNCVEAMCYLNQLNIFTTDGKWGKTICVGDRLTDIDEVDEKYRYLRKDTYESASAWNFGFGAIYSGITNFLWEAGKDRSEIQFFKWDGTPVYKATLPIYTTSFDINVADRILYAIDKDNDVLMAYDASDILKAFGM